ncbi:GNAT family N-acetyltransferase [Streptomyces sp. NPDC051940]|uniref:GNAT family N-acetyltransferase n=1 Tax=Streptomyces sp. NPDC051940 TaxID=3155675 RepID=UPI003446FF8F
MPWTRATRLDDFETAAGAFLRGDVVRNTVPLTVLASLHRSPGRFGDEPPELGWWTDPDGAVAGAYLRTPPFPPLLSLMPGEAAAELARLRAAEGLPTPGVNAMAPVARAFAAEWNRLTGATHGTNDDTHRLYRLEGLIPPDPPAPGRARPAAEDDRALLVDWIDAFGEEARAVLGNADRIADTFIGDGFALLWEDGGRPVSLVGWRESVDGMNRIGPVYTPPGSRGRGYAAAATAAASRAVLDSGVEELLLFTDLANPTSNSLYQRLGYRPLEDALVLRFDPAG